MALNGLNGAEFTLSVAKNAALFETVPMHSSIRTLRFAPAKCQKKSFFRLRGSRLASLRRCEMLPEVHVIGISLELTMGGQSPVLTLFQLRGGPGTKTMDVCAWAGEVRRQGCMLVKYCEDFLCPASTYIMSTLCSGGKVTKSLKKKSFSSKSWEKAFILILSRLQV